MRSALRRVLGRHARSLSAFACLLAVAMQLALPLLHQTHGGHEAHLVASHAGAGYLQAQAPQSDHGAKHEPATCPQCRMLSHSVAPSLRVATVDAPDVRASRVEERLSALVHSDRSGHEGPPRAPPFPA